ncbi:Oidioi.mRNA.OKI2018_I69.PAR.g12605.t1.cds [Oikopleura dioica]|uniref:T-complex protein 1 subunit gamma n=1 Tax=Oikopleura dioica TaxID=34765 RepID=A0ABN7S5B7_OIKDI|nr:Oidioi.mRNA.OKI2018_I69.PAR.g12605.t1.cds [Oikopleura dioica]
MSQIAVLKPNTEREQGSKVQLGNVQATKHVADIIRTCLGPRSMYKMLMDPQGGIVVTNDGNAILREIMVKHPAAKSMIEISRTQDEECGDGTTSVIILAGEIMSAAQEFLEDQMHPTKIINAYRLALEDIDEFMNNDFGKTIDPNNDEDMAKLVNSALGTKFISRWMDLATKMAIKAVRTVHIKENGRTEIDIKRFAKVEKIPGGHIEDSEVLNGVMLNKDITHPKMKRRIENPRILLLDCSLEYQKGESQTDMELSNEADFTRILQLEENYIKEICDNIIALKPTLVFTEKGISDLAQHFLAKAGITAIRRVRKTDNLRIARCCGATIKSRTDEISEDDIGTEAGLFEIKKNTACTIILRGASKDVLMEVERNLQDAMQVARNVLLECKIVPGGGACELAVGSFLNQNAKKYHGEEQFPYRALARALEVIPRTLVQNCGGNTIRTLTELRALHAKGNNNHGVNGETGKICDMEKLDIWEPLTVKLQVYKTAIETATLLLRIDDIVQGTKRADGSEGIGAVSQN